MQGEASTYEGGLGTGPVEVTQTNVPYSTRVLVRYPKDASKFSGRVVVEPFNTSNGGKDLDAVWSMLAPLLQQRGDAWVGVTERTSAGEALKQADATRYADINVPSNDVAWDVLAQVGAAVKRGRRAEPAPGARCRARLHGRLLAERCRHRRLRDRAGEALRHAGGQAGVRRVLPGRAGRERHAVEGGNVGVAQVRVPGVAGGRRARRQPRGPVGDHGVHCRAPGRGPGHARAEGVRQRVVGDDAARRLRQEGRPVPALRGGGHAPRAGRQRWLRRPRLDVPDPRGGPGHVRAPQPLGRDRQEAAARAPREAGRAREELQGVGRRERQHRSVVSGRPTSTTRSSATTRRRPARSPAGSRATRLRSTAPRWRRSTRASTPT